MVDGSYSSVIEGRTTEVRGRFNFSGPRFQLISDGSIASGAPGQAAGSLDLLITSLATCMLNRLRGAGDEDTEVIPGRPVRLYARAERYADKSVDKKVGALTIEVFVGGVDDAEAEALIDDYRAGCRIHRALATILDIDILGSGEPLP